MNRCGRRRRAVSMPATAALRVPRASRHGPFLWLLVPAVIMLSSRVQAAEPPAAASSAAGNPVSPAASGNTTPGAPTNQVNHRGGNQTLQAPTGGNRTLEAPNGPSGIAPENAVFSRPNPFGFGGTSYVPGFSGCGVARVRGAGQFMMGGGIARPLVRPQAPANEQGRYIALSLDAAEIYTDNLKLEHNGESDFVTNIAPRLDACANNGRVRGNLEYQLQGLVYAKHGGYDRVYNHVAGQTTIEVLPRHFYIGADTHYGQRTIDPSFGYSRSNVLRPGHNRTGQWATNVTPYYLQSLGPVGQARLRYRYGKVINTDSDVSDTTVNAGYLDIDSPPQQAPLSWQVNAYTQEVHRSGGDPGRYYSHFDNFNSTNNPYTGEEHSNTTHFDRAMLQLGYQLTYEIRLLAEGGVEDDYRHGHNDRFGSAFYGGGFRWTSASNSLEFRVDHRFFGVAYYVQATHRGRNFDASVNYRESPSSQGLNAANGNAMSYATSYYRPSTSLFDRGVFVEKRLQATGTFHTAITRTTLRVYSQHRDYSQTSSSQNRNSGRLSNNEHYVGGNLQFQYQLLPRTAIVPEVSYERNDSSGAGHNYTADIGATLAHELGPTTEIALGYGHAWRRGGHHGHSYDENRVVLGFSKGF